MCACVCLCLCVHEHKYARMHVHTVLEAEPRTLCMIGKSSAPDLYWAAVHVLLVTL